MEKRVLSNYRFNQTCAIKQSLDKFYKLGLKYFYTSNWTNKNVSFCWKSTRSVPVTNTCRCVQTQSANWTVLYSVIRLMIYVAIETERDSEGKCACQSFSFHASTRSSFWDVSNVDDVFACPHLTKKLTFTCCWVVFASVWNYTYRVLWCRFNQ